MLKITRICDICKKRVKYPIKSGANEIQINLPIAFDCGDKKRHDEQESGERSWDPWLHNFSQSLPGRPQD